MMTDKNNYDAIEEAVRKNGETMERLQESIRPALEKQEELRSIVESATVVMPTVAVQPSIVTALTQVANNNALNNYRESMLSGAVSALTKFAVSSLTLKGFFSKASKNSSKSSGEIIL